MSTSHKGHCNNCDNDFDVIITWTNNDEGNDVSDINPRVCPKCGHTYVMRFDVDSSKWHGVIGSNG